MNKYITTDGLEVGLQIAKSYIDAEVGMKQPVLVSGTNIKTINGESILGEGNVVVGKIVTNYAAADGSTWTLSPNTVYNIYSIISELIIEDFTHNGDTYEEYMMVFRTSPTTTTSITLPEYVYGVNGIIPEIELDTEYELYISARKDNAQNYYYKAALIPFKTV